MIGEVVIIGKTVYIKTNKEGSLEKLPKMKWFRILQLWYLDYWHKLSIGEVREFCDRYKI